MSRARGGGGRAPLGMTAHGPAWPAWPRRHLPTGRAIRADSGISRGPYYLDEHLGSVANVTDNTPDEHSEPGLVGWSARRVGNLTFLTRSCRAGWPTLASAGAPAGQAAGCMRGSDRGAALHGSISRRHFPPPAVSLARGNRRSCFKGVTSFRGGLEEQWRCLRRQPRQHSWPMTRFPAEGRGARALGPARRLECKAN